MHGKLLVALAAALTISIAPTASADTTGYSATGFMEPYGFFTEWGGTDGADTITQTVVDAGTVRWAQASGWMRTYNGCSTGALASTTCRANQHRDVQAAVGTALFPSTGNPSNYLPGSGRSFGYAWTRSGAGDDVIHLDPSAPFAQHVACGDGSDTVTGTNALTDVADTCENVS